MGVEYFFLNGSVRGWVTRYMDTSLLENVKIPRAFIIHLRAMHFSLGTIKWSIMKVLYHRQRSIKTHS